MLKPAEAPAQIIPSLLAIPELSVSVIEGVGIGFTTTVAVAVLEHPALVTVTVYVVVVEGLTRIVCVVAPLLQV